MFVDMIEYHGKLPSPQQVNRGGLCARFGGWALS